MIRIDLSKNIKGFGFGILGFLLFLGFLLMPFILIFGILKVSEFLYPVIAILAGASIVAFLFIILPLSLVERLQGRLAGLSVMLSYIVGTSVFMFSFLTIFDYWGWLAVFFIFMFHLVAPIAMIGLLLKGKIGAALLLFLGAGLTYGMRFYAVRLSAKSQERVSKFRYRSGDVIDIEASIEDENSSRDAADDLT